MGVLKEETLTEFFLLRDWLVKKDMHGIGRAGYILKAKDRNGVLG
jgi:hypothetical protein